MVQKMCVQHTLDHPTILMCDGVIDEVIFSDILEFHISTGSTPHLHICTTCHIWKWVSTSSYYWIAIKI